MTFLYYIIPAFFVVVCSIEWLVYAFVAKLDQAVSEGIK